MDDSSAAGAFPAGPRLNESKPNLSEAVPINLAGRPAVAFQLADAGDQVYELSDFSAGWLLLVFHRHLM